MTPREGAWRDAHGKTLQDYPRPSVAVDTAVLTVTRTNEDPTRRLCVLVTAQEGPGVDIAWGLPGTFLHVGERLADAVLRSLRDKAGIEGLPPQQLHVFDDLNRDPRGWVLSVGHMAVVPEGALAQKIGEPKRVLLPDVTDVMNGQWKMPFDHQAIVQEAVDQLRDEYTKAPDPRRLLREPFTLRKLEALHRTIDPNTKPKDTFRRHMTSQLCGTGTHTSGSAGKPAQLFTHP